MHGNCWEWCQDYYGPYKGLPLMDPLRIDRVSEDARVVRGGSWYDAAGGCRAARRDKLAPAYRSNNVGFRVTVRLD